MAKQEGDPTADQVLEWLDAWSQTWRWETGFRQYERWAQWRRTASECHADAYKAQQLAAHFPGADPAKLAAQSRKDGADAERMADNLHAIALRDDGQRLQIANWLRANKLFDAFEEFPTMSSFGERPSAEDVREAARQMQRVRACVEAFLADGAPVAGFLGLTVDGGGTVRREGKDESVTLRGGQLDLFRKVLAAKGVQVKVPEWRRDYPNDKAPEHMKSTVVALNKNLRKLDCRVKDRTLCDGAAHKPRKTKATARGGRG